MATRSSTEKTPTRGSRFSTLSAVACLLAVLLPACGALGDVERICGVYSQIALGLAEARVRDRKEVVEILSAELADLRLAEETLAGTADDKDRARLADARAKAEYAAATPAADLALDMLEDGVERLRLAIERKDDAAIRDARKGIAWLGDAFAYWVARETEPEINAARKKRNLALIERLEAMDRYGR